MAIKFNKCDHTEAKSLMICVRNAKLIEEIFNDHHIIADHESYEKYYLVKSFSKTELNSSEKFEVENIPELTLRQAQSISQTIYQN